MLNKSGLYILIAAILISIFSIRMDSPPAVIGEDSPDSVFSARRAYPYLQEICRAPHSTGTPENKRVREYILDQCKQFGLESFIQQTTSIRSTKTYVSAANVYNVVARLKGKNSTKSLLVMTHFDSQPNTPGTGDDGAGVAAMLETARILTSSGKVFMNDIIFLFTDAEESGLQGAQGFVQDSVLTSEIGLVLNFEGRGNSGVGSMFEVNAKNGWAVTHFVQSAAYPAGNSLGYEIYKTLPNDTDYTVFREAGISGLNHAFIEGFVNYHSPTDKAENLDLRSLQQHGSNMLSLVKHFGNISLLETKAADISFFSAVGNTMIYYPASWNLGFTVMGVALFIAFTAFGMAKGEIGIKGFIVGFSTFLGLLIVLCLTTVLLIKGIEAAYPLYKNFYSSNSYNSSYYFIAFTAMAVSLYGWMYRWLLGKFNTASLFAGVLLLEVIVLITLYIFMPTAIFIMVFPLGFTLIGNIILLFRTEIKGLFAGAIQLLFLLPSILLLSPSLKLMFIVFGLSPTVGGAVIMMGLFLGLLLPIFSSAIAAGKSLVPQVALACFAMVMILAHFNSGFTEATPLQSNVQYQVRKDENKAFWISPFTTTDDWNKQFFPSPAMENGRLINEAAMLNLDAPAAIIKSDSVENNVRKISMHCQSVRGAISMRIEFGDKNQPNYVKIDGPAGGFGKAGTGDFRMIDYFGLDSAGFDITMEVKADVPLELTLIDRSLGLPLMNSFKDYPTNVVPGTGYRANTTQVIKKFTF